MLQTTLSGVNMRFLDNLKQDVLGLHENDHGRTSAMLKLILDGCFRMTRAVVGYGIVPLYQPIDAACEGYP